MQDDDKKPQFIRWYDRDEVVSNTMQVLETLPGTLKRQVATYLIEEIISRKPYADMFPLDTHYLIISENRRRRWYDYDEIVRIFIELLRHTSDSQQREICNMVIAFIDTIESSLPAEGEE